ncbi:MAG TPA: isoprenyl transferase [Bacteroidales bacterium]|nr:isoprenyl transferase [Bacteroidales bacterium]
MSERKQHIITSKLPEHIAIIMDGNGRWAKQRDSMRIQGHRAGAKSVREVTEACAELGVKYLTLYAFSTENWNRPKAEVSGLMNLLVDKLDKELSTLTKNNIRLTTMGDTTQLPEKVQKKLRLVKERSKDGDRMCLNLALSYSGRWDITNAAREIAKDVKAGKLQPEDISQDVFADFLATHGMPDPDLMIRTSGETRISNYLLYQLAYTELYFTDTLWPDFGREELYKAILDFQSRERRFGKTSEQL